MAVVFGLSAAYLIWCLYKATRYMREHPDEFRWSDDDERKLKGSQMVDRWKVDTTSMSGCCRFNNAIRKKKIYNGIKKYQEV